MHQDDWDRSAQAWIDCVDARDLNRTCILDPALLAAIGDVAGKRVLDMGCGEGRFSRMLAALGACVVGLDPTDFLIRTAKSRSPWSSLVRARGERLPIKSDSQDVVVAYLVLIDILDFRAAISELARVAKPGGRIAVANLSSFWTSSTGWCKDGDGNRLHVAVDNYLAERADRVSWCGIEIINYHRPLEAYFAAYLSEGLILERFEEPTPRDVPRGAAAFESEARRAPGFNLAVWRKP